MSDLVVNPTKDIIFNTDPSNLIRPMTEQTVSIMSGGVLASTTFILGSLFMLIFCFYIIYKIFGQPMSVASKGDIIQHFDTPKSAIVKEAIISGGACRYRNLKDGTLAVTTKSIVSINGKNGIITFAGFGVSIPIPQLAAMTKLSDEGYFIVYDEKSFKYKLNKSIEDTYVIISGYNFNIFREFIKQTNERRYIPLQIECIEKFSTKNISADYTEKKIKIRKELQKKHSIGKIDIELIVYGLIAIGLPLLVYMLIYK